MAGARLVSYAYSQGQSAADLGGGVLVAAPTTALFNAVQSIAINESGTIVYARPNVPTLFDDLLTTWQTSLSMAAPAGAPSGTYTVSWSATTNRVTIASTVFFKPVMPGRLSGYLGFTQSLTGAAAASWTGASAPHGTIPLAGVTVRPAEDKARVQKDDFRLGRTRTTVWGNLQTYMVKVVFTQADVAAYQAGWCFTGKIRIYQGNSGAYLTAHSPSNLAGYVEGWVIQQGDLKAFGAGEDYLALDLTIGVQR
jgi:hypothetical protein